MNYFYSILLILTLTVNNVFNQNNKTWIDENIKINQVQIIGSHNSYKQVIDSCLFKILMQQDSSSALGLEYSHIPITKQLDMGLRNLEIDICYDPEGGRYAKPYGLQIMKKIDCKYPPYDTLNEMASKGFKVLHMPDIDFRSSCLTLKKCLEELKEWSANNPNHLPVFITMNMTIKKY